MVIVLVANKPLASVTFSTTVYVPGVVGVPVNSPVSALMATPDGKPVALQALVLGIVPLPGFAVLGIATAVPV